MDALHATHRKELKDLQSRITQKKKNATKKTRKGVNDECDRLERELVEKQRAELDALEGNILEQKLESLTVEEDDEDRIPSAAISGADAAKVLTKQVTFDPVSTKAEAPAEEVHIKTKRPNRQKARLARRAAEQEAQIAAAEQEAANQPDRRELEMTAMKAQIDKLRLQETFIRPDGHCLFSACATSLPAGQQEPVGSATQTYQTVRATVANYITQHGEDFSAFLEEPLENYVNKIRDTAEWGGHLELQAISRSYKVCVNVLRSDGRVDRFSPTESEKAEHEVWLAYYQHSFGLGEHYNALHKVDS